VEEKAFRVLTLDWRRLGDGEPIPAEPGLYQLYGDSLLYGRDVLLYIGQAGSLASRLGPELVNSRMIRVNNLSVRVALCDRELLDVAESVLIANHKPSMNAEYVHSPKSPEATERLYLVQNHGDRGALTLQVTNSYWCDV
jgi:hypothetical protein